MHFGFTFPNSYASRPSSYTYTSRLRRTSTLCATQRPAGDTSIPAPQPRRRRHFVNLTNGLEAASALTELVGLDVVRVTRLQSSHCEAGAYDKLLNSLGPELLWSLATGYECLIYDFGSRDSARGVPRALFLGLQFIGWALQYLWYGSENAPLVVPVRGKNVVPFWRDEVMPYKITRRTKKACRYYAPFAVASGTTEPLLRGVYGPVTNLDGRAHEYAKIASNVWQPPNRSLQEHTECDDVEFEHWLTANNLCLYDPYSTAEQLFKKQRALQEGKSLTDQSPR